MDEVKIKDEIGKEIREEQRKSYIRQIEGFEENLKQVQEAKENYQKQWEIDKELYDIILKGMKKLRPDFEYELMPRYWELRRAQGEFKYRQDLYLATQRLKGHDVQMDNINKELESLREALKKLDEEDKNE